MLSGIVERMSYLRVMAGGTLDFPVVGRALPRACEMLMEEVELNQRDLVEIWAIFSDFSWNNFTNQVDFR